MTSPRTTVAGYTPTAWAPPAQETSSLHPALPGGAPVPIFDLAYGRHTRQSSAQKQPASLWMYATEPEEAPFWEIDLASIIYIDRLKIWLAPIPADAEVEISLVTIPAPSGDPPPGAPSWRLAAADLPTAVEGSAVVMISTDTIARFVRVTVRAPRGEKVELLVRGAELSAARLFADTLLASYARAFTLFADRPLFSARRAPGEGEFAVTHLYRDAWHQARSLAAALADALAEAIEREEDKAREDRVFLGLSARNRPEWVIADLAAVMRGYVVVPLSPDDSEDRLAEILTRCPLDAILLDGGTPGLEQRLRRITTACPTLRLVVLCEGADRPRIEGIAEVTSFADLCARGAGKEPPPARPREGKDLYSLLFTSGSSGAPKGAMRSYATFHSMLETYGVAQPAVHLSFQPLSHLSERMYLPSVILQGGLIGFSGGGAHLLSDLRALEPTLVGSVPRLFEILRADHQRRLAAAITASPREAREALEARVSAETRLAFGRRLQGVGVGSAPVSPELFAFLQHIFAGLWVTDGYGSTECGTITIDARVKADVKVKLVPVPGVAEGPDRGEICVWTPHLVDGYFGDPEATRASRDEEGFFRTGDLGERTADGGVIVIGRVKNVIKLAQGEFVAVDRVEAELSTCPVVDRIFVHPDSASAGLMAVVVPEPRSLASLLATPDLDLQSGRDLDRAAAAIARALAEHGRRVGLAGFEIPRAVLVEAEPFTVESGLLTASGKAARPALVARYAPRLAMLDKAAPVIVAGESLADRLVAAASAVIGRVVDAAEPLHEGLGVDSLVAAEVMRAAGSAIGREIPLASWFSSRSLQDLARRLDRGALGSAAPEDDLPRRDLDIDIDAALDIEAAPTEASEVSEARAPFEVVLLTGATGLLGAHLLEELLARTGVEVVCLVRADSDEAAAARVREALARSSIPPLPPRWRAIAGDLAAPGLGLAPARARALAISCDAIVHAGAAVNWLASYDSLRNANVLGTAEILRLARTGRRKPVHFVSTISTAPSDGDEASFLSFTQARVGGGYGLSKWVAESLARRARERGHPVAVYRPGMITGHSARGIGNPDDYVHRYLRACITSGRYLDAAEARLDMTPVDHVAGGLVALMASRPRGGGTYHLTNLEGSLSYRELGQALSRAGVACAPAGYADFRTTAVTPAGSPLRPLQAFFPERGFTMGMGPWPAAATRAALAELGVVCPKVTDRDIALAVSALARQGRLGGHFIDSDEPAT